MSSPAAATPLRVLAVDHNAAIRPFRKRFEALARNPGLDLTVFIPERWVENYRPVRADVEAPGTYRLRAGRVVWPGYENRAFFTTGLGTIIRETRPDILHLWEEPFSVITLQALWHAAIWAPRAKVLFFSADNLCRDFRYPYRPWWFYAGVERLAHGRCAAATVVSGEAAEVLRAKGYRNPVEVVPLGLDLADYPLADSGGEEGADPCATPDRIRARFGLDPPIVGYAGRLLHQKGVDVLLRAVASLSRPRPSLVIVGDGPERGALEALARDLGIAASTRFFPLVPHEEVPALLRCVDVLVLPSRTTAKLKEQFGRILVEGMAAGCVVIGSSSGEIPAVLGDAGLVFSEGDVAGLAEAIGRVVAQPELRAALRTRGRCRVREHFTWEVVAERLVEFYRRVHAGG